MQDIERRRYKLASFVPVEGGFEEGSVSRYEKYGNYEPGQKVGALAHIDSRWRALFPAVAQAESGQFSGKEFRGRVHTEQCRAGFVTG